MFDAFNYGIKVRQQTRTSNSSHKCHAYCKKSTNVVDREPISALELLGIPTFGLIRSIIVRTVIDIRWVIIAAVPGKGLNVVWPNSFGWWARVVGDVLFLLHDYGGEMNMN